MDMSCAPTLSLHYLHYLFHSTDIAVLVSLHYGLCTIVSYHSSTSQILFHPIPTLRLRCSHAFLDSDTVHAPPVLHLRYSPPPLYTTARQYTCFYLVSSFGLRVLDSLAPLAYLGSARSCCLSSQSFVLFTSYSPLISRIPPDQYPQLAH